MPKSVKPYTTRKRPEPSESHAEIDEWIGSLMPHLQPIVRALDELIRETVPRLHFALKRNRAHYGSTKVGWMIELAPYAVSVNVVFFGGVDLEPPPPLGDSDRSRYIKVRSLDEAQSPEMRKWIKQAGRVKGWT